MVGWKILSGPALGLMACVIAAACASPRPSATPGAAAQSSLSPTPAATAEATPLPSPGKTATRASSTSSGDDAGCSLLPMADVAAALGEPVVAHNNFGCEYDSVRKEPFKVVRFIDGGTTPATFESGAREIAKENGGADSFTPVSGIGDAAFSWHDDQGSARLDIRKGTRKVEIWVDLGVLGTKDLNAKQKIALKLGAVALARM